MRPMRPTRAQSLIETLVGVIVLIPIVLFLFDVAALVLANSANDNLAKHCARAAASATNAAGTGDGNAAQAAAVRISNNFATSLIIKKPTTGGVGGSYVTFFDWAGPTRVTAGTNEGGAPPAANGQVVVISTMLVNMPVPFPFFQEAHFRARAVEPIVSIPP